MLDIVFGLLCILAILLLSIGVVVALVAAYREDRVRALNPDYRGQHRATSQWGGKGANTMVNTKINTKFNIKIDTKI